MQVVIDSSVFVSAFRGGENESKQCFQIIRHLELGKINAVIPTTVLLEVVAAMSRRTDDQNLARRVGSRLVSFPTLSLIDLTTFRAWQYLELARPQVGRHGRDRCWNSRGVSPSTHHTG